MDPKGRNFNLCLLFNEGCDLLKPMVAVFLQAAFLTGHVNALLYQLYLLYVYLSPHPRHKPSFKVSVEQNDFLLYIRLHLAHRNGV